MELNSSVAMGNLGWRQMGIGELAKEFRLIQSAARLNPAAGWAQDMVAQGNMLLADDENAERYIKRSLELQPDYPDAYSHLFRIYLCKQDRGRAAAVLDKMKSIAPKEQATVRTQALAYLFERDYSRALACYEQLMTPDTSRSPFVTLGYLLLKLGRQDEAHRLLDRGRSILENSLKEGNELSRVPYSLSAIYAVLGNKKEALDWLQKAVAAGWRDYRWALVDPLLENLHGDAQFDQLISGVKSMVDVGERKWRRVACNAPLHCRRVNSARPTQ